MSFSASSGPAMTYLDGANLRINLLQRGKDCMSSVPGTNILWNDSYGQRTIHFFGDEIKIHKIWWNFKTLALLTKFWHYYSKLSIMVWGKFSLLWMTIFRTNNAAIWSHCRAPTGSRYIATIAGKSSSQNDKLPTYLGWFLHCSKPFLNFRSRHNVCWGDSPRISDRPSMHAFVGVRTLQRSS